MGHQIVFYLTPEDMRATEVRIRSKVPVAISDSRPKEPHPHVLPDTEVAEMGKTWLSVYLVRPEDLGAVKLIEVRTQHYWAIDELRSPVIELNRCFFDGKILRSGRVYYTDGYYGEDGAWVAKPWEFIKWAKDVFSAVKKSLKKNERLCAYVGPDALVWQAENSGELVNQ